MKALCKHSARFVAALLCILALISALPFSGSSAAPSLDQTSAVVVYNLNNERILLSKNLDGAIYPASTVKLLSGLIFTEKLSARLDERVTVTNEMIKDATGRRFSLHPHGRLTAGRADRRQRKPTVIGGFLRHTHHLGDDIPAFLTITVSPMRTSFCDIKSWL